MSEKLVLKLEEIPDGGSLRVDVAGHEVALFRRGERIFAIAADCPHRGGPLEEGSVNDAGFTVACPWHGWEFNLESGKSDTHPGEVRCFNVEVSGGEVIVEA